MITQNFIYKAAQAAFGNNHPKFPWPKKNELEEQSDQFKRAMLQLTADINVQHDREKDALKGVVESNALEIKRLRKQVADVRKRGSNIVLFLGFIIGALLVFMYVSSTAAVCINEENLTPNDVYVKVGNEGVAFLNMPLGSGTAERTVPLCK